MSNSAVMITTASLGFGISHGSIAAVLHPSLAAHKMSSKDAA
jgi:hypothetical protein